MTLALAPASVAHAAMRWLQANSALLQAVGTLAIMVLTYAILRVYQRQRDIMHRQAQLLAAQQRLQELCATSEFAPLLLPMHADSFPFRKQPTQIQNMGRGCAFAIATTTWYAGPGGNRRVCGMGLDADFLSPASTAFLRYHFNGVYPEDDAVEVAVLHYQDFLGQVWHTTWNLDPGTGQPAKLRFPVVWNKQKWEEHSHLVRFCEYCGLQAQPG